MTTAIICLALFAVFGFAGSRFLTARALHIDIRMGVWNAIALISSVVLILLGFQWMLDIPAVPVPTSFWIVLSGMAGFSVGGFVEFFRN
jgi:hypothetical protein